MAKRIRKAVFPVAGLGTRFLPATRAMPKEMLTVVDRPVIQHVVDEARDAGIEHFVFVTGRNKGVIEDHFDVQAELEANLKAKGKVDVLDSLRSDLPEAGSVSFTRQREPLGLGHAVLCAKSLIGEEPFALLLPDMVMKSEKGCLSRMIGLREERGGNIVALEEVDASEISGYGVVDPGKRDGDGDGDGVSIVGMVEKPAAGEAPSNLILSGRYILEPEIFGHLEQQEPGSGGEIQLTDAMIGLLAERPFHGLVYDGETFDCGSKAGFLAANVAFGMEREDLRDGLAEVMRRRLSAYDEEGR